MQCKTTRRPLHAANRTRQPARRGFRHLPTIATLAILSLPASADLAPHRIEFQPSPSPDIAGYMLHLGVEPGAYASSVDIGAPSYGGDVLVYEANLNTGSDLYVALSAYDAFGNESIKSNEFHLAAAIDPTSGTDSGTTSGTDSTTDSGTSSGTDSTTDSGTTSGTDSTTDSSTTGGTDSGSDSTTSSDPDPTPTNPLFEIGLSTDSTGLIAKVFKDGSMHPLTLDSLAASGDLRPDRCDLDGDGDSDIVLGFGSGSAGAIAIVYLQDGSVASMETITVGDATYHAADGQTYPACGDVDGDGGMELVIGMGPAADMMLQVLDGPETRFAPYDLGGGSTIAVSETNRVNKRGAALVPALGDIDGDKRDELVVGFALDRVVHIAVLDDATAAFVGHPNVNSSSYLLRVAGTSDPEGYGSGTYPSLGDWDGDGLDEIVVGFGRNSGGWMRFLDDAQTMTYDRYKGNFLRLQAGRTGSSAADAGTTARFGNVDEDAADELVVSLGRPGATEMQIFDDLATDAQRVGTAFIESTDADARWIAAPPR
jgi:hypothetical protein